MRTRALLLAGMGLVLVCGLTQAQQMYKWKDDKGVVHYSDTPPPVKEKQVQVKDFSDSAATMSPAVPLPYALAQAVKSNPVTLYTTAKCLPCDQTRNALQERGVPFTEKTIANEADRARLAQAGGNTTVPFVTVGSKTLNGYAPAELQAALTAATYPLTKRLPAGYQNPPVQNAAPAGSSAPVPASPAPVDNPPAPLPAAPGGIRF